ncbi:MAG: leucine-rich repeat domain-containing protein [Candidatus Odinarchaeota archaeon]
MGIYQEAVLSPEEVTVLKAIEEQIGKPVPYKGDVPYEVDPDAYGSNPDEFYIEFGFRTKYGHVTELGLNRTGLRSLPESFGQLKWLNVIKLENNGLKELPASIGEIKELYCVYLRNNSLTTLPTTFKVQQGDPFEVFQNSGTKLDLRGNPLNLTSLLAILKLDHETISTEWPDRIRLHQSADEYDFLFILVPNELFLHPIIQRLDFTSLKIVQQPCPRCDSPELLTGRLNVTQQDQVFCPACEREISLTPLAPEIREKLKTQLGQLELETGIVFPEVDRIDSSTYGYTGDPDHVIGLGFFKAELREIPESIGNITTLQALCLGYTNFQSIPESIGKLTALKELYMWSATLQALPGAIGELSDLETLELSFNCLKALPETFGNLANLQFLKLSYNQLTSLPETFGDLGKLQNLDLRNNQLTSLPDSFGNLHDLRTLDLAENQLETLPESIGTLKNLEELILSGNKLTSLPESFWNLAKLITLEISGNPIEKSSEIQKKVNELLSVVDFKGARVVPEEAEVLKKLEEKLGIYLSCAYHSRFGPAEKINYFEVEKKHVKVLKIGGNGSKVPEIPECIGQLPRLQELDINAFPKVTTLPESISKLTELRKLSFYKMMELNELPESIGELGNLEYIDIILSKIKALPASISKLEKLHHLKV